MTELTHRPASTIHSAIGLRGSTDDEGFKKIEADCVLVDESSMIEAFVFLRLLESVGEETQIILIGDFEQLPSVGPGLILRDLINSERLPVTRLTTIFRQAMESQITMNSYAMIRGDRTGFQLDLKKEDFYFLPTSTLQETSNKLIRSFRRMHEKYQFSVEDICLLSPMRKGELGIDVLNPLIQDIINPFSLTKKECYIEGDILLREGDRVMQTTNNKDLGVFNGEVGQIERIELDREKPIIYVSFPDKDDVVIYRNKNCCDLQLAYCMTIHKSQGSEFPVVVMPIHLNHKLMLNRNLIYTAWTRAKQKVICVGDWRAIECALLKADNIQRLSQIKEKIRLEIELDWEDETQLPF